MSSSVVAPKRRSGVRLSIVFQARAVAMSPKRKPCADPHRKRGRLQAEIELSVAAYRGARSV
jgi:hypothetical protein